MKVQLLIMEKPELMQMLCTELERNVGEQMKQGSTIIYCIKYCSYSCLDNFIF